MAAGAAKRTAAIAKNDLRMRKSPFNRVSEEQRGSERKAPANRSGQVVEVILSSCFVLI
jgi:hypothetical protein